MRKEQIALQIWTLRDLMAENLVKCYEETAKIGYAGIEMGDAPDMNVPEYKKMLDDLNLKCVGCHVALEVLENDLNRVADQYLSLGTEYIVVPWLGENFRTDQETTLKAGKLMASIAGKLSKQGLKMCYHNHNFEFVKVGGRYVYDLLAESFTPEGLGAELDVYWVKYGNEDPLKYIEMLSGRVPILHMKDMEDSEDRTFTEVGHGTIDMPAIVRAGDRAGTKWFIVEQDVCKRDPLESVRMSYETLAGLAN